MSKDFIAADLFSAAKCNMDCNYCYIEKNEELEKINDKVIEHMKENTFIEQIKELHGENLEAISLWGTEPTMNMEVFIKYMLPELFNNFSNFNTIRFSTNLLSYPEKIVELGEAVKKQEKKGFLLRLQFSDDGLLFSDVNRHQGASQKIIDNMNYLMKRLIKLSDEKCQIEISIKPTLSINNIEHLLIEDQVYEWYNYFEDNYLSFFQTIENNNIFLPKKVTPTLVIPDNYTEKDGEILSNFFAKVFELSKKKQLRYMKGTLNGYSNRFSKMVKNSMQSVIAPYTFTCSAGDGQIGVTLNGNFCLCHRGFFVNEEDYMNKIAAEQGFLGRYTFNHNTEDESRIRYIFRTYHDFLSLKMNILKVFIYELAINKQIDEKFLDSKLSEIFALFLLSSFDCVANNLSYNKSLHIYISDLVKLWGNGAFTITFKDYMYWQNGGV